MQHHPYHIVTTSLWPLYTSALALGLTVGGVSFMRDLSKGTMFFFFSFLFVILLMSLWWRDVIRESAFMGVHTLRIQSGLRFGVLLFIVSEVMFFFAFFWGFFHSSLAPTVNIGVCWPPEFIFILEPGLFPLFNTLVLLSSGASITYAHHALRSNDYQETFMGFYVTLVLAGIFTGTQLFEYIEASYNISDSIYGTTFYMTTGFHGFHVLIGSIFIGVCWGRFLLGHYSALHHVSFEGAAWYWHFVDVVWLFLFVFVYFWSSLGF